MKIIKEMFGCLIVFLVMIILVLIHPLLLIPAIIVMSFFEEIRERLYIIFANINSYFRKKKIKNIEIKEPFYPPEYQKMINLNNEIINQKEKSTKFTNYNDYLKSPEWRYLKEKVLSKAGYKCSFCNRRAYQVHHIKYPKRFEDDKIEYLVAVCKDCHTAIHEEDHFNF